MSISKIFPRRAASSPAEVEAQILTHLRRAGALSVTNLARLLQRGTADTALLLADMGGRKLLAYGPLGWGLYGVSQVLPVLQPEGEIHPYAPKGGEVLRLLAGGPRALAKSAAVEALALSRTILPLPDGWWATREQWRAHHAVLKLGQEAGR